MKRTGLAIICCFLAGLGLVRADQTTSAVQQALKEEGFYYGDVTGQKSADTTAALRRYQIRNGLQITGEIDAETLRSLGVGSPMPRSNVRSKTTTPAPAPAAEEPAGEDESPTQSAEIDGPEPAHNYRRRFPAGSASRSPSAAPAAPHAPSYDVFAGTPYAIAPPDLQRRVVLGAQTLLSRYGYYRSGIDGVFGPGTEAAVRFFQSRAGLAPDGQLNMETLSALGLLPGQRAPAVGFPPRRFRGRPIYRGQLVPGR